MPNDATVEFVILPDESRDLWLSIRELWVETVVYGPLCGTIEIYKFLIKTTKSEK